MFSLVARAAEAPWAGRVKLHGEAVAEALARALAMLMEHPERLQALTRLGHKLVQRFRWRDEQEKLLKLCGELGVFR